MSSAESQFIEYKSAFSWNPRSGRADGDLIQGTVKSVAAFANTAGGQVVIGVRDDETVCGIDEEIAELFTEKHVDQFENLVHEHLKTALFPYPFRHYAISFEQRAGHWICRIVVKPIPGITFVKSKGGGGKTMHTIYVRTGNRTVKLEDLERDRFVATRLGGHWTY